MLLTLIYKIINIIKGIHFNQIYSNKEILVKATNKINTAYFKVKRKKKWKDNINK